MNDQYVYEVEVRRTRTEYAKVTFITDGCGGPGESSSSAFIAKQAALIAERDQSWSLATEDVATTSIHQRHSVKIVITEREDS